jgi:hypothetical protein
MKKKKIADKEGQRDAHSLPGTNQAGKGPGQNEDNERCADDDNRPGETSPQSPASRTAIQER